MRWIEILDEVPYWEFCLICANMAVEDFNEGVPLGYETVHDRDNSC